MQQKNPDLPTTNFHSINGSYFSRTAIGARALTSSPLKQRTWLLQRGVSRMTVLSRNNTQTPSLEGGGCDLKDDADYAINSSRRFESRYRSHDSDAKNQQQLENRGLRGVKKAPIKRELVSSHYSGVYKLQSEEGGPQSRESERQKIKWNFSPIVKKLLNGTHENQHHQIESFQDAADNAI